MAELTNLTDRLSHLRDRKGGSAIVGGKEPAPEKPNRKKVSMPSPNRERKFATDYFMIAAYALLAVALGAQFVLLMWLDLP